MAFHLDAGNNTNVRHPDMSDKDLYIFLLWPCLKSKMSEKEFWLVLLPVNEVLWHSPESSFTGNAHAIYH